MVIAKSELHMAFERERCSAPETEEAAMTETKPVERATEEVEQGKRPSTAAGEFVREEMHHIREGKHGARSTKQAIAIGLSKARRAGVKRVFIGLENINPNNLSGARKNQNKITEYRKMLLDWKRAGAMVFCGYIIGFPHDTPDSIAHDVRVIQKELPIDIIEFTCLTPLPGSEDHRKLYESGVPLESDLNRYDIIGLWR